MGIDLPDNYADDLTTKPSVQLKARQAYNKKSPLTDPQAEKEYVNFYAYLNKKADEHIEKILDTLDATGLTEDTIIIRTADHGELGLSHGMREKAYTVYEEMIHIPLIISNPKLFPQPRISEAFYCHLDLLPTIAELAGVPEFDQYGKGVSIVPILNNTVDSVQDSILFTYDDTFFLPEDVPGGHIRAIRQGDWIYAVYYSERGSDFEYEMYNLKDDPGQLDNLLFKNVTSEIATRANHLHIKLKEKIDQAAALPIGFPWPSQPF
jgi:arylsulfatase A-like enzyme